MKLTVVLEYTHTSNNYPTLLLSFLSYKLTNKTISTGIYYKKGNEYFENQCVGCFWKTKKLSQKKVKIQGYQVLSNLKQSVTVE